MAYGKQRTTKQPEQPLDSSNYLAALLSRGLLGSGHYDPKEPSNAHVFGRFLQRVALSPLMNAISEGVASYFNNYRARGNFNQHGERIVGELLKNGNDLSKLSQNDRELYEYMLDKYPDKIERYRAKLSQPEAPQETPLAPTAEPSTTEPMTAVQKAAWDAVTGNPPDTYFLPAPTAYSGENLAAYGRKRMENPFAPQQDSFDVNKAMARGILGTVPESAPVDTPYVTEPFENERLVENLVRNMPSVEEMKRIIEFFTRGG